MSSPRITHWLCATGGVLVGGLMIRYIGFAHAQLNHVGMRQFFRMWLWFDGGVAVAAISSVILKLTIASKYLMKFPRITFIGSVLSMIKLYPTVKQPDETYRSYLKKIASCAVFWFVPSIHYCVFDFLTLEYSFISWIYLLTICFTVGTIIPLKHAVLPDFGLKVIIIGICLLLSSILCWILKISSTITFNISLIVILLGIIIDDLQHLKVTYGNIDMDDQIISLNPLKKSFPIFLESALMFGRLATLTESFIKDESNIVSIALHE